MWACLPSRIGSSLQPPWRLVDARMTLADLSRPVDREATADTERFRLRRFVERLIEAGECEIFDKPIDLVDVAGVLDGNAKAVLFTAAGPEKAHLVGNVMGSRRRLAAALDTDERALLQTLSERLKTPQA